MQNPPASLEPGEYIWSFNSSDDSTASGYVEAALRFNLTSEQADPVYGFPPCFRTELISFDLFAEQSGTSFSADLTSSDEGSYTFEYCEYSSTEGWALNLVLEDTPLENFVMLSLVQSGSPSFDAIGFSLPINDGNSIDFWTWGSQLVQVPAPGILSLSLPLLMPKRRKRNRR